GSAFLWARADRQADLHPVVISHGFGKGFLAEFDWTGTRDPSPALCVPAALDFHARLGGPSLRARNAALAAEGAALVAQRLNSEIGAHGELTAAMGLVRLPVAQPADDALAWNIRGRLMDAACDAPVHALDGALWLRLSAFAYNEADDYVRLADLLAQVLRTA
ncbi:MAG: hypothetical protein P4L71_17860, partial [Acetobacteraceae bacterium]|nr:hypothetical protein [Acetobacteraceae bacterium]